MNREQRKQLNRKIWESWDWTKNNAVLAQETSLSWTRIHQIRKKLGKTQSPFWHKKKFFNMKQQELKQKNRELWDTWDWTKNDTTLAREQSLSRERIRQIRNDTNKPKSPFYHKSALYENIVRNKDKVSKMTRNELVAEFGGTWFGVDKITKKLKLKPKSGYSCKYDWSKLNWNLPSADLEKIWNIPFNMAATYRYKYGKPQSKYDRRENGINKVKYQEELKIEQEKAAQNSVDKKLEMV